MPNNRYQSYENYDYNTPRRSRYGEGRRLRGRNRDYYNDYNDFEDNTESSFSYADDDDNPIYAQPGFSGEQSWGRSSRSRSSSGRIGRSQLGSDIGDTSSRYSGSSYDQQFSQRNDDQYGGTNLRRSRYGQSSHYNDNFDLSDNEWDMCFLWLWWSIVCI